MEREDAHKKHRIAEALRSLKRFSISTFATTILRFGIRLIKNVVFTRLLGPAERGVFALLTTIPELIVSFGNLGFGFGSMYLIAKRRYDLKKVIGNLLLFIFITGLCLVAVGYGIMTYKGILKDDSSVIVKLAPLVLFIIPFVLLQRFGEDLLMGVKEINFMNKLNLLFSLLPVVLLVFFWLLTGNALNAAMYSWAISVVIFGVAAFAKVSSDIGFKFGLSAPYFKEAFSYGGRSFVSMFAGVLVRRIDYVLVSSMLGAEALGYYAVSVSIAEIVVTVPEAVNLPYLPIRLGLDNKEADSLTPIITRHVMFVMTLVCLIAALSGQLIILILFGKKFLPAYGSLVWLLPGVLLLSIHEIIRSDLYSYNLPGFVSWSAAVTLACNLVLNFILIPRYGISGAAISSSVSYGLGTFILMRKFMSLSGNSLKDMLLIKGSDIKRLAKSLKAGK
jgi:O-antigen/teichoic acid export membrane protein